MGIGYGLGCGDWVGLEGFEGLQGRGLAGWGGWKWIDGALGLRNFGAGFWDAVMLWVFEMRVCDAGLVLGFGWTLGLGFDMVVRN
jgi:hypothetical protein